jgi:hypothetical protein
MWVQDNAEYEMVAPQAFYFWDTGIRVIAMSYSDDEGSQVVLNASADRLMPSDQRCFQDDACRSKLNSLSSSFKEIAERWVHVIYEEADVPGLDEICEAPKRYRRPKRAVRPPESYSPGDTNSGKKDASKGCKKKTNNKSKQSPKAKPITKTMLPSPSTKLKRKLAEATKESRDTKRKLSNATKKDLDSAKRIRKLEMQLAEKLQTGKVDLKTASNQNRDLIRLSQQPPAAALSHQQQYLPLYASHVVSGAQQQHVLPTPALFFAQQQQQHQETMMHLWQQDAQQLQRHRESVDFQRTQMEIDRTSQRSSIEVAREVASTAATAAQQRHQQLMEAHDQRHQQQMDATRTFQQTLILLMAQGKALN